MAYLSDPNWIRATLVSFRVAILSTALATIFGCMLAFGLSRGQIPARGLAVALVLSPIIMPTIVVAVATYFCWRSLVCRAPRSVSLLAMPFIPYHLSSSLWWLT